MTKLKKFLGAGGIGTIQTVCGYYTKGTLHNGTHWFDLARFLIGDVSWALGYDRLEETGDDPTLDAQLGFTCGATAYLHACDAGAFSIFEMDLIGTFGRVRIVESGHVLEIHHVVDSPRYSGYQILEQKERLEGGMENTILRTVEDLVHCMENGSEPACSGADGVAALEIAFAVRESVRSACVVNLRSD
jgi:predicted dehydrogenase